MTRYRRGQSAALALLFVITTSCLGAGDDPRPPREDGLLVERNITYRVVDGESLGLDVYRPDGEVNRPVVLVLYGRGWRGGSKEGAGPIAAALARRGFVTFAPDYREAPPGGRWHAPAPYEDVVQAARWILENGRRYGADTDRFGALGWSAGGNLAMLAGTLGIEETHLDAVVSWSGPPDLLDLYESLDPIERDLLVNYVGCPLRECRDLWEEMSPARQVTGGSAPTFIVNSAQELVPASHARATASRLSAAGVPVDLEILDGSRHGTAFARDISEESIAFLRRYLR